MVPRDAFIATIRTLWPEAEAQLHATADEARAVRRDPHWFWTVLVSNYCTNDGSENLARKRAVWGDKLRWSSVVAMTDAERTALFTDLPNPRRRRQLTAALEATFVRIRDAGGPENVAAHYEALPTGKQRRQFLATFDGIGAKYSRNIPMDIYDELVLDHAALDRRLHGLLDAIEDAPPRTAYHAREEYLRQVQQDAELPNMWYLDRLLYQFEDEVQRRLAEAR